MISRSDLPQLNATVLHQKGIPYEYIKVTLSSVKPIQSDRLPFDDSKYLERYTKIVNDTYNPLIVDQDFNLIDGHHRYDIMRRIEFLEVVRVLQIGITYQEVIELFKK
mgnify:CR=1 FL=1|tara:strand:- start:400 stop:723 length:324 start_codon:yes stop_codon:yes gene_type:complete